jgi:hypothetical protein
MLVARDKSVILREIEMIFKALMCGLPFHREVVVGFVVGFAALAASMQQQRRTET